MNSCSLQRLGVVGPIGWGWWNPTPCPWACFGDAGLRIGSGVGGGSEFSSHTQSRDGSCLFVPSWDANYPQLVWEKKGSSCRGLARRNTCSPAPPPSSSPSLPPFLSLRCTPTLGVSLYTYVLLLDGEICQGTGVRVGVSSTWGGPRGCGWGLSSASYNPPPRPKPLPKALTGPCASGLFAGLESLGSVNGKAWVRAGVGSGWGLGAVSTEFRVFLV